MKSAGHSGTLFQMSVRGNQHQHPSGTVNPDDGRGLRGDQRRSGDGAGDVGEMQQPAREVGGPEGPEPTRYGDWEKRGRCIDF